jgi:dolichyl-diphosphooligosaccharide--protein glycosyltransferase
MTLLFVLALLVLRRYSSRLLVSYSTTFGVAIFIAANVPKLGFNFLREPTVLAAAGVFLLLCMYEITRYIKANRNKTLFVAGFLGLVAVLFIVLSSLGLMGTLGDKFWSVINPSSRLGEGVVQQLIQSVQEHRPATWGSLYYDIGIGILFIPVGLYFVVRNPTNRNIFLTIFGLTAIYFAGSMVRLNLLMAPAVSILWAIALVQVVRPFITILREKSPVPRRKMRFRPHVGKEFSTAFIILMFLLLTVTFVLPSANSAFPRVVNRAYSPTTIAAASLPLTPSEPVRDWLDALNWMRVNLEPTDVVVSWWDYGYWITNIANKTTLADNGALNSTQIGMIGRMFMANETGALEILGEFNSRGPYNVTYVVVFQTFTLNQDTGQLIDAGYGDEGKWRWMARIGGLNDLDYGNYTLGNDWFDTNEDGNTGTDELIAVELGRNSLLYKLMYYGKETVAYGSSTIELEHFEGPTQGYFSQTSETAQNNLGIYGFVPLVTVYKINYD